ncbi:MAG: glutathione S-transferase family protein [Rhizobiaceae bacterium]
MGVMIEGKWHRESLRVSASDGRFQRSEAACRNWVTPDGSPGPSGIGGFKAEPGRYHLYVSYACPWAHRTLIFRKLKKLEDIISVSVVHHFMGQDGWTFDTGDGATGDTVNGKKLLNEVYASSDPTYSGRVTVPVLWDKQQGVIVSNESSEIIRMFNSAFNQWADTSTDYYPEALRSEIDEVNAPIYANINNGVYRCGFASTQEAYEEAFDDLFSTLDMVEKRLSETRYLCGPQMTEADWRLFPTLVRFDPVYVGHFKCNLRRIADYPNLPNYTRDLFQVPGVAETVNLLHIKNHYYASHETINPTRVVPKGPEIDYSAPHDRDRF